MKKIIMMLAVLISVAGLGITAQAEPKSDTVVALGADLSAEQRAAVLELMELTEADLEQ